MQVTRLRRVDETTCEKSFVFHDNQKGDPLYNVRIETAQCCFSELLIRRYMELTGFTSVPEMYDVFSTQTGGVGNYGEEALQPTLDAFTKEELRSKFLDLMTDMTGKLLGFKFADGKIVDQYESYVRGNRDRSVLTVGFTMERGDDSVAETMHEFAVKGKTDQIYLFLRELIQLIIKAHSLGIVLVDLKLANMLYRNHTDGTKELLLNDFDSSMILPPDAHGVTFQTAKTLEYSAPEQVGIQVQYQNPEQGFLIDVFIFGLIAYYMLNGARFPGNLRADADRNRHDDFIEIQRAQENGKPGFPLPAYGTESIKAIILRALSVNPASRPAPAELRDALDRVINGTDTAQAPVSPPAAPASAVNQQSASVQNGYSNGAHKINILSIVLFFVVTVLCVGGLIYLFSYVLHAVFGSENSTAEHAETTTSAVSEHYESTTTTLSEFIGITAPASTTTAETTTTPPDTVGGGIANPDKKTTASSIVSTTHTESTSASTSLTSAATISTTAPTTASTTAAATTSPYQYRSIKYAISFKGSTESTEISGIEITGMNSSFSGGTLTIPQQIDGIPVVSIGKEAFKNLPNKITSLSLSNVQYIGESAFDGSFAGQELKLGNVLYIGARAFRNASALRSVTLSDGLREIGTRAFFSDIFTSRTFDYPASSAAWYYQVTLGDLALGETDTYTLNTKIEFFG